MLNASRLWLGYPLGLCRSSGFKVKAFRTMYRAQGDSHNKGENQVDKNMGNEMETGDYR